MLQDPQIEEILKHLTHKSSGATQIREIVPIEEWLESPYYCGADGLQIYDYWKQEMTDFFNSGYPEWIMYGSLGSGKTTAGIYAFIRKFYELSCYEPIPLLWNLMQSSTIFFIYFSISLAQANRTGYGRLHKVIDAIPYFQKHFPRNMNITSELKFRNLSVIYGSSLTHQIGLDLLGALLDEGDFYEIKGKGAEEFSVARDIYTTLANRRKLRFSIAGKDTGLSILASSPAYGTDFVEKRMQRMKEKGGAHISEAVGYEIVRSKFQTDTFSVFPGTEDVDPHLLDAVDDVFEISESLGLQMDTAYRDASFEEVLEVANEMFEIIEVPVDLKDPFEEDLPKAIRDILGRSLKPIAIYMDRKSLSSSYWGCMSHPFTKQVISLSTKNDIRIEDFLVPEQLYHPELPRFIHIDQSITTDRTGLACSFLASDKPEVGYPDVVTEWMLAISPPAIGEIPILRVAEFITYLQDLGYYIARVTMDSYQSRASLQYLESEGIDCALQSVDRTDEAYINLRNLIANKCYHTYHYSLFAREMTELIWDRRRRKIDHPMGGSKDVTDGVSGSIQSALEFGDNMATVESISPVDKEDS